MKMMDISMARLALRKGQGQRAGTPLDLGSFEDVGQEGVGPLAGLLDR